MQVESLGSKAEIEALGLTVKAFVVDAQAF
jgi:hypothetical protein